MVEKQIIIETVDPTHFNVLAKIHMAGIQESFNTSLGEKHLVFLYSLVVRCKGSINLVAKKEGEIVGFLKGVEKQKTFRDSLIKMLKLKDYMKLIGRILLNPMSIYYKLKSLGIYNTIEKLNEEHSVLNVIVVKEGYQSIGVGKKLLQSFEMKLIENGIDSYYVDCLSKNKSALKYYTQNCFQEQYCKKGNVVLMKKLRNDS